MTNFPIRNLLRASPMVVAKNAPPIGDALTLIQKRFSSTSISVSSSPLQDSSSFTAQYLINSCGLSSKSAISTSQKLTLDETKIQNPNSVLKFLKSNGLDDTHIAKLVQKHPAILRSRVESNLIPKWEYFIQNGYTGKLLAELVVSNPVIIDSSLYNRIKPVFEFLKELLGSNDSVIKALTRCSRLSTYGLENILKPNVDFMMKGGVPVSSIAKLILLNPRVLMQKPVDFARDFNAVKELGLDTESPLFVHALRVMAQMSESTLSKKVEVFKSLGWTQEDIVSMFRRSPFCLACSEEKIKRAMDFFVNTVKVERQFIIAQPILITYGLDKMRRRYNILKVLESKKLLKLNNKVANLLTVTSEETFLKYYVDKYKTNIPGLEEMYHGAATRDKFDRCTFVGIGEPKVGN